MSTTTALRKLLETPGIIHSLGAHDAFSALLFEEAGVPLLFLGGFGVAASSLGLPDVGLLTLTEMAEAVRRITDRLQTPLIADGDTGHGDLHNVARTVRQFERAGAAGILLEDQVFPKRCGHFVGKQLIAVDEMRLKLRAALDARRDPEFVVIARTDARAVEGIDAAIERIGAYAHEGVDVGFVEAPQSVEELERIPREGSLPLLVNMLSGGVTPIRSTVELEQMGYKIAVCPVAGLLATGTALRNVARDWLSQGRISPLDGNAMNFDELKRVLRVEEFLGLCDRLSD